MTQRSEIKFAFVEAIRNVIIWLLGVSICVFLAAVCFNIGKDTRAYAVYQPPTAPVVKVVIARPPTPEYVEPAPAPPPVSKPSLLEVVEPPVVTFPLDLENLKEGESRFSEGGHAMHIVMAETLSFGCGNGAVIIHFKDGRVEYVNCDPHESGKAFWVAVGAAFPEFKDSIKKR